MAAVTRRAHVTASIMLASFLAAIEVTVIATAMPRIAADLGGVSLISWVYAAYLLTMAVTTPVYGKLADLFGRKAVMTTGMVFFLGGSALCGLSRSMAALVAFRALQGVGAGAVLPVSMTIVGDIYELEERGRVQGLLSSIWGIASIVGPLAGGFLVDNLSWHWVFFVNVPFGLLSIGLLLPFFHEAVPRRKHRIDYAGALAFTAGMCALLFAMLTGGRQRPWSSPEILGLLAAAAVFLAAFGLIQARASEPIVPVRLFAVREITVSNWGTLTMSAILIGSNAYLPLWIQDVLGYRATSSGLTLIPSSIAWPIAATVCARLLTRTTPRVTAGIGAAAVLVGCLWLSTLTPGTPPWVFVPLMLLMGGGMGFAFNTFLLTVQTVVPWELRGSSTASNSFVRALGQTTGVAFFGTLLTGGIARAAGAGSSAREALASGLHGLFVAFAVLAVLSLIAVAFLPHRLLRAPAAQAEQAEQAEESRA
jgi:EmrB/QacA subfamily drug resistance transporter